jgi:CDP-glucose 4,6-dehydratase
MRAFVTGATGFLGSHLVPRLGPKTVSLIRDRATYLSSGMKVDTTPLSTVCHGDLSDLPNLERILAEYRIDTVFHLAAQTEIAVGSKDPIGTFESNIRGTWNVLEACRRQRVGRIIVASSDKCYGRSKPPYKETMPLLPDRPYETSKACVDLLAKTYAETYAMSIATTRSVNLYGPGCLSLSTLVPNTIKRLLLGEKPMVRNGGVMRRDWLYVEDAVDAYIKLSSSSYVGPMNIGGGEGISVRQVVDIIMDLMGKKVDLVDEVDTHGEIVDQWTDASLARKVIGWTPAHTLKDGLRKTIEWYKIYFAEAPCA